MQQQVDIDEILSEARVYAPLAPEPLLVRFFREVAREFCSTTLAWRDTDEFTIEQAEETLCTVQAAEIMSVDEARLDGTQLTPVTLAWLDERRPGWRDLTDAAAPARWITQVQPDTLIVVPFSAGRLAIRVTLQPSRTTQTLPRFLIDHHAALLGKGAAGRTLVTPGEWANPQLGAALYGEFRAALPGDKARTAKGQQRAPLRTRARMF